MALKLWQELPVELTHVKHFNFRKKVKQYLLARDHNSPIMALSGALVISKANPMSELIVAYNFLFSHRTL